LWPNRSGQFEFLSALDGVGGGGRKPYSVLILGEILMYNLDIFILPSPFQFFSPTATDIIEIYSRQLNVTGLKHVGTTQTNVKCVLEEMKSRLNSGNLVQNHLSCRLLYKNVNIKIYRIVILPVVL
jgi:hypothetical protein